MIEKERLEQIIKENKDFWWLQPYGDIFIVREIKLPRVKVVIKEKYCVLIENDKEYLAEFEHLTEDKESAYEFAEFGNITRTERLPYFPKYENIEYERGYFIRKFHIKDNYDGFGKLMVIKDSVILVQCSSLGVLHEEYFNEPTTKENYDKARRLCVKLFKGELV